MMARSGQAQDGVHELIIVDLDPSIPIIIQLLEALAELLDDNTSTDESIKGDSRRRAATRCGLVGWIYPGRGKLVSVWC